MLLGVRQDGETLDSVIKFAKNLCATTARTESQLRPAIVADKVDSV